MKVKRNSPTGRVMSGMARKHEAFNRRPANGRSRIWMAILFCLIGPGTFSAQAEDRLDIDSYKTTVAPYFQQYCIKCHGPKQQKASRRFDKLTFPIKDDDTLTDFQDALDLINLAEMPPEDAAQPRPAEQQAVTKWLTAAIQQYQSARSSTNGQTVLRRINRREYLNTVSDLFALNTQHFDPTAHFPADQTLHHLDNQGKQLVTSSFLLNQYLKSAQQVIAKALPLGKQPEPQQWTFTGGFDQAEFLGATLYRTQLEQRVAAYRKQHGVKATSMRDGQVRKLILASGKRDFPDHIRLYEHPRTERHFGSYGYISEFADGVPHDGFYEITLNAEARYRTSNYEGKKPDGDRHDDPITLAIVPGSVTESALNLPQRREPELARFELADDAAADYRARVWLDKGATPRFIYVNGFHRARKVLVDTGTKLLNAKGKRNPGGQDTIAHAIIHGEVPQIRIHKVSIRGPFYDQWPSRFQRGMLGGLRLGLASNRSEYQKRIRVYLRHVWRRPISNSDVQSILSVIKAREDNGVPAHQAYLDGLSAALCMPSFVYLSEPSPSEPSPTAYAEPISDHHLAARLSYFLWSSTPDKTLMQLADQGRLSNPAELNRQFERMLKDPKSDRFVRDFLDVWLNLAALGQAPPDTRQFPEFYTDHLQLAMKQETFAYMRHMLDENLSIDTFIDSDFTFVNNQMARFYGLDVRPGNEFQLTRFVGKQPRQNRGGLLGQPSVLTVTANGVDTSPITRGVWILENILGTSPSPPPPDIEPLEPDIRGAKTVRDQLEKHRSNATCAECHRKIDPLGFALENFDAIGRWRNKYRPRAKQKIDASGSLPGGKEFREFSQFKKLLLTQREKVARSLVRKLFSYSLGRDIEISDRPQIDTIISELRDDGWKLQDLVRRVVLSPTFRHP